MNDVGSDIQPVKVEEIKRVELSTLTNVEKVINEYAKKSAQHKRYGLRSEHFVIKLVTRLERGHMSIIPGNPVEIFLLWPHCQPIINSQLASAFSTIHRFQMWRTSAIIPAAFVKEGKKMARIALGEANEILSDLIPRQRLRVIVETIVTFKDAKTGESVSTSHKSKEDRYDGNYVGMWLELSRVVNEKYPDVEEPIEDQSPMLSLVKEAEHG